MDLNLHIGFEAEEGFTAGENLHYYTEKMIGEGKTPELTSGTTNNNFENTGHAQGRVPCDQIMKSGTSGIRYMTRDKFLSIAKRDFITDAYKGDQCLVISSGYGPNGGQQRKLVTRPLQSYPEQNTTCSFAFKSVALPLGDGDGAGDDSWLRIDGATSNDKSGIVVKITNEKEDWSEGKGGLNVTLYNNGWGVPTDWGNLKGEWYRMDITESRNEDPAKTTHTYCLYSQDDSQIGKKIEIIGDATNLWRQSAGYEQAHPSALAFTTDGAGGTERLGFYIDEIEYMACPLNRLTGACGDPYITTLSGITYKMADFTGFSRMLQGTLENKPFTLNTETTLLTKEELTELAIERNRQFGEVTEGYEVDEFPAYFSKLHASWGEDSVTIDLKDFKVVQSTTNETYKTESGTGKQYNWSTKETEQENMLIPFGPVTLVVKNIPNPDVRNGFTILGSEHITDKVGALVKPMYVKDIKLKSLTSMKLIKDVKDRTPKNIIQQEFRTKGGEIIEKDIPIY
jgi:hypothetical protein